MASSGSRLVAVIVVLLVVCQTHRADKLPPGLEGEWLVTSIVIDGMKVPADSRAVKSMAFRFKGKELVYTVTEGEKATFACTFDLKKKPAHITLLATSAKEKGRKILGIYKLAGGKLTLCVRDPDAKEKGRPTEFASKPGSGITLAVLERE